MTETMSPPESPASSADSPSPAASEHEQWKAQQDRRSWAMLCHVSAFASVVFPFGNILGPLVVWLVKRQEFPVVDDQGKESLNFQISMTVYSLIAVVVLIVGISDIAAGNASSDFPTTIVVSGLALIALGIINIVLVIIASVRSYQGDTYRYPLTIRFVS